MKLTLNSPNTFQLSVQEHVSLTGSVVRSEELFYETFSTNGSWKTHSDIVSWDNLTNHIEVTSSKVKVIDQRNQG